MSSETKSPALNLYGILDNELERMHALMHVYMQKPKEDHYARRSTMSPCKPTGEMSTIFARIVEMQDVLIAALKAHDPLIQEKVAELALTGTKEN